MVSKHFFKILLTFLFMIAIGMAGVLFLGNIQFNEKEVEALKTAAESEPCTTEDC
jgi:cytoskeletal protein RodZ